MSVLDTLVFDRTQADVDRVLALKNKILMQGWSTLTEQEQTEWSAGMKGAYNASDLNRVGEAIGYVAELMEEAQAEVTNELNKYGIADADAYRFPWSGGFSVSPKTDWTYADIPTAEQAATYLLDINTIASLVYSPNSPAMPVTLDYFTYGQANAIEQMLSGCAAEIAAKQAVIMDRINHTKGGFVYSGDCYSGEA